MTHIALVLTLIFPTIAATSPYDDALKAAIKVLSTSPSEHDLYKGTSVYIRRDLEVRFNLTESAHCELTIHRASKITYTGVRALGPESPDPEKFYEIPLSAMAKDLIRKNEKSDEQAVNAGAVTSGNSTTSKTYLASEDTVVSLAGLDAKDAKPNEVSSTKAPRFPAYGDEKSATAAIASLAALAAACR